MFTSSNFKMTVSFFVIASITSTTRKRINNIERKHRGIFSLNLKELANRVDDLKIILILQNQMLLLVPFCKHVLK